MTEDRAVVVDRVVGWKLSDDKAYAVIGLESGSTRFAVALSEDDLERVLTSLVAAKAAFVPSLGEALKMLRPFAVDALEVGEMVDTRKFAVNFHLAGGGALAFLLDRAMLYDLVALGEQTLRDSAS